jgi:hypothetical protein
MSAGNPYFSSTRRRNLTATSFASLGTSGLLSVPAARTFSWHRIISFFAPDQFNPLRKRSSPSVALGMILCLSVRLRNLSSYLYDVYVAGFSVRRICPHTVKAGRNRDRSMSAEPADPDFPQQAAWLKQLSKLAGPPGTEQRNTQIDSSGRPSTTSSESLHRLRKRDTSFPIVARRGRNSNLFTISLVGFTLALVPAIILIPQHLSVLESRGKLTSDHAIELPPPESLPSAAHTVAKEPEKPKLNVEGSRGAPGEPAAIGVTVQGDAHGAFVNIRGLLPGMELSTGDAVGPDGWELSASDLQYAWVAPPQDFTGSVDLLVELRLPNAQVTDRQTVHIEWMRPPTRSELETEPERIASPKEIEPTPPMAPGAVLNRGAITPEPTSPQDQLRRNVEAEKDAREREKNSLHPSVSVIPPAPPASPPARGNTHRFKGFWDWSR